MNVSREKIETVKEYLEMYSKMRDLKEAELEVREKYDDNLEYHEGEFKKYKLRVEIYQDILEVYEKNLGSNILKKHRDFKKKSVEQDFTVGDKK